MIKSQPVIYRKLTPVERHKLEEEQKDRERRFKDRLRQSREQFMASKPISPPSANTPATAPVLKEEKTEKE
jgi:hypothetical protein